MRYRSGWRTFGQGFQCRLIMKERTEVSLHPLVELDLGKLGLQLSNGSHLLCCSRYYAVRIHIIYPTKPNNGIRFMKTDAAFLPCPIILSRFRAWRPPPCPGRSRGTPAGKVH